MIDDISVTRLYRIYHISTTFLSIRGFPLSIHLDRLQVHTANCGELANIVGDACICDSVEFTDYTPQFFLMDSEIFFLQH